MNLTKKMNSTFVELSDSYGFDKDSKEWYALHKLTAKLANDVRGFIKQLEEGFKDDWEFCKKANCEPHIHPRRAIERLYKFAGDGLI